jgi:hypothetical protein
MFAYFISMKPGHFKTYSTPENSFWCCVGTGMENHARYGEAIYAHDSGLLYVNLFIASELNWPTRGVVLRQETAFPEQPSTRLRWQMREPARIALKIRQPFWAASGLTLRVNDQPVSSAADDAGYLALAREWKDGDTVEVGLPMALRTEALPGNPGTVAFFYGPVLLAGALGTNGLPEQGAYADEQTKYAKWATPPVPTLSGEPAAIVAALKPVPGQSLTFKLEGARAPAVTLMPFYRLHHQRYTIYWPLEESAAATAPGGAKPKASLPPSFTNK